MSEFGHLLMKAREAMAGSINVLSTGEALAAALVLNRFDWLSEMGYTITEALERIGPVWVSMLPEAARTIRQANEAMAVAAHTAHVESVPTTLSGDSQDTDVNAALVTYGESPGYRSASFTFDLQRFGAESKHRVCLHVNATDSAQMAQCLLDIHRHAWGRPGQTPIDIKDGEQRPRWLG